MQNSKQHNRLKQLFTLFIALPAMLAVILAWTATDESVAQLKLDYAALKAAEDDYRAEREFSGLSGAEAADYAAYVARLQRRVFEDCQAVLNSGSPYPEDLPCPVLMPQETESADITMQAERTAEEQVAALDDMLMAGLGEYDERLLREQERIKADSGGTAGTNPQSGQAGGQPAGGPVDSSQGSADGDNDSDQPTDIPDGSDDDVVARQLREAAEQETDPELKEKLWEEYRRYKRGTK